LTGLADLLEGDQLTHYQGLTFVDAVAVTNRQLASRLPIGQRLSRVAVHPTCSAVHLRLVDDLMALARLIADEVYLPPRWGCCGFAGDRGFLHPELTASATTHEAADIAAAEDAQGGPFEAYVSCNRTCELGISRATGRTYRHVLEVVAEQLAVARA
jgi:D-lactate dehydrogenase